MFISCNSKRMPASMLLPLEGHFSQTERFVRQAALSGPRRKRYWQAVVRHKIRAQSMVLTRLREFNAGLPELARRVRSGDVGNIESQAARRYWSCLFLESDFRRSNDQDPRNALLNYGYAILRAASARALCAAGLHPSFGLHHSGKYNPFVLADDVMEPWRPAVDNAVFKLGAEALDTKSKIALLEVVTGRYIVDNERRSLFDALGRTAQSLANAIQNQDPSWEPPEWGFCED
jgi:CRISPR-associated protein Cas1